MEGTEQPTQEQAKEVEMTDSNALRTLKVRSIDGTTFEVQVNKDVSREDYIDRIEINLLVNIWLQAW